MRAPALAAPLVDAWRPLVAERCGPHLRRMAESLGDQAAFAEAAAQMIRALGLIDDNDPSLDQDTEEQNDEQAQQSPSDDKTYAGYGKRFGVRDDRLRRVRAGPG